VNDAGSRDGRQDPDELLRAIDADEALKRAARLRVFLGMSAGVGKTYAMLKAAHLRRLEGFDVVIGVVETHGRIETAALLEGLEIIPRRQIEYKGALLDEMDIDAILKRKPEIVIVDELAHTNIPGSRHAKRYQDVLELLDAGIDVFTAVNVQHLESRKESVESITQVPVRETVPDSILERANQMELVDIAPVELLKRLKEGKVYLGDKADRAAENFFKEDRLTALREIALRMTAERVDQDLQRFVNIENKNGPWQTNERLMVAISHSPSSEKLIRATRRLAYNLDAPWIAVYIDTGISLGNEDQAQLAKNLSLARELKAEVITTTEANVAAALKRIVRQKNVTQIIVGRPAQRRLRTLLEGGTLLDRLVRESSEVDVHVIRQDQISTYRPPVFEGLGTFAWNFKSGFASKPIQYWNTFWFLSAIAFLSTFIDGFIGYRAVGFIFLLGVLIVGMVASLGPVLFAAVASALAWNYFFIPPKMTLIIREPEDVFLCLVFLVVALILGYLTHRIRFHERLIREREDRTNVLYEVLKDISNSSEKSEFLLKVMGRVGQTLNANCGVFLANQDGQLQFDFSKRYTLPLDEKAQAVASWSFSSLKPAGWSTETLADSKALFIPLKGLSETVGVFVFVPKLKRHLNLEQENLLYSIVRQLAISLERHSFEKRLQESKRLEESEKLHQTLLNSISHEMRTPLTAILGSASALEDDAIAKNPAYVKEVASHLAEAGDRLNRVIENLLDMSRLNSGVLALKLDWHDVHDLIGVTLKKIGKNISSHTIRTVFPEALPFIKIDFRLMEHAISNLILNAASYSPAKTTITISVGFLPKDKMLKIIIDDQGPGIPEEASAKIFEKFYRVPGTPTGGTGLGLSIVKSIVEAHGGTVTVGSNPDNGARFTVSLPAKEEAPVPPGELETAGVNGSPK
jgi:two-component system, OmpR family, sensor histidine kinase KdpD